MYSRTNYPPNYVALMRLGHLPTSAFVRDNSANNPARAMRELKRAVGRADEVLAQATGVFPFNLFPDTITIDREKITIAHRIFFSVAEVISVRIEDILNVTADVGPFFGSLKITTRYFDHKQQPYKITFLRRADAMRLKRIAHGYLIARKKNIDCSKLTAKQLREALDELGKTPDNNNAPT
jgi:hypothetical protein